MSKIIGHYDRDCWNPTKRVQENVNLVIKEEKKAIILLLWWTNASQWKHMDFDNGANNHMCRDKGKLMELNESIRGYVTFVDHLKVSTKEKCMILILYNNKKMTIIKRWSL